MSSLFSTSQRGLACSAGRTSSARRRSRAPAPPDRRPRRTARGRPHAAAGGCAAGGAGTGAPGRASRPFDQPGMSATTKLWADAHHAQVGVQRGERIVGDLRPRVRHRRDERGLAGVGHAQQADVGQHRSSSRSLRCSPGQPGVFWRGARFVLLLKCRLPKPPSPPLANASPSRRAPAVRRAPRRSRHPETIVPMGMRS